MNHQKSERNAKRRFAYQYNKVSFEIQQRAAALMRADPKLLQGAATQRALRAMLAETFPKTQNPSKEE